MKKKYCVPVVRTDCLFVEAENMEEAINIAEHRTTDAVSWSDEWNATDAFEDDSDTEPVRVLFLDYDGVVNTPMWNADGSGCRYNFPSDGKVNNFQAVQWVSEFCQKAGYHIVVTSTWRLDNNYKECLVNGGLRKGIEIFGKTESLDGKCRGDEIKLYLETHPEIEQYIIVDDKDDILEEQRQFFVQTDGSFGFGERDMLKCEKIHKNERLIL